MQCKSEEGEWNVCGLGWGLPLSSSAFATLPSGSELDIKWCLRTVRSLLNSIDFSN